MTPALAAALKYIELGWAVLPLYGLKAGRCTCGDAHATNNSAGKHPHRELVPHGVHDASKDPARIREWFARVPGANVGIATGAASGFVVLDVDPRNGSDDTLAALQQQGVQARRIILVGGGAQSAAVQEAAAQLLGISITVPRPGEYVADGAARQAAAALTGEFPQWALDAVDLPAGQGSGGVLARYRRCASLYT